MLQSTDWNFLIGAEVECVWIYPGHAQLSLFRYMSIDIYSAFNHERGGRFLSDATDLPTRATTLVSLLRKAVKSVSIEEKAIDLRFERAEDDYDNDTDEIDEEETLTLLVSDAQAKSFVVTTRDPNRTFVVG